MSKNIFRIILQITLGVICAILAYSQTDEVDTMENESGFTFIGHASVKIVTENGTVIYIDPAFKGDYSVPADIILVTHGHSDHNQVDLVMKKGHINIMRNSLDESDLVSLSTENKKTTIITHKEALVDGEYKVFDVDGVKITAVKAENKNHNVNECVGYVLEFDGIKVYHAGDTSKTDQMEDLGKIGLDYVFLPIDGIYNMNPTEATECANILKAKVSFPIHNDPRGMQTGEWYDTGIDDFKVDSKVILKPTDFYRF